jgi:hypothetical protein
VGKQQPSFIFIDKELHESLICKDFNEKDLVSSLTGPISKLSITTKNYLIYLNSKLQGPLVNSYLDNDEVFDNELKLLKKDYINKFFIEEHTDRCSKLYEIRPIPETNYFLIVIDQGFILKITESKDEFEKFLLDCLCAIDKYKACAINLMSHFLALKMSKYKFTYLKNILF